MATVAFNRIRPVDSPAQRIVRIKSAEAASQTFVEGDPLYVTSNTVAEAGVNNGTATISPAGFAVGAAGGTSSDVSILLANDCHFIANVYHSTAASATIGLSLIGLEYGLVDLGSSGKNICADGVWAVDLEQTNYKTVRIIELVDDAADTYGRVKFQFLADKRQLDNDDLG